MKLNVKMYDELTKDELYEILKLRCQVFVVDQNCPYLDLDDTDKGACHVFYTDENGIQAYLRVLDKGVMSEHVRIGRVISLKRRCGIGTMLVKEGIKAAVDKFGADTVFVEAQTYVKDMYAKIGFVQTSDEFLDVGIPHVNMELKL
ncbi:MAG: GNAT family N-acetyltransferase [Clostridia bacterium]|nr:GNAT family N-acetyltransferase [Clostridia bacterium]